MQNGRNILLAEATFDLAPLVGKREQQVTLPLIYGKVETGRLGAFISIIQSKDAASLGADNQALLEDPSELQRSMSVAQKRQPIEEETKD